MTGRFPNENPSGFSAGDVNHYRCVGNNPFDFTHPAGRLAASNFLPSISVLGGARGLISGTIASSPSVNQTAYSTRSPQRRLVHKRP